MCYYKKVSLLRESLQALTSGRDSVMINEIACDFSAKK